MGEHTENQKAAKALGAMEAMEMEQKDALWKWF